jgi:hypothetical protein
MQEPFLVTSDKYFKFLRSNSDELSSPSKSNNSNNFTEHLRFDTGGSNPTSRGRPACISSPGLGESCELGEKRRPLPIPPHSVSSNDVESETNQSPPNGLFNSGLSGRNLHMSLSPSRQQTLAASRMVVPDRPQ